MPQYEELNTLRSFTAKLNTALSTPGIVSRFADLLVENKLVGEAASRNIVSPTGIDDYSKASRLTSAVYTYVKTVSTQEKATSIFNTFVLILYDNLELKDVAQQLVECRGKEDSAYKNPLPLDSAASGATGVSSTTDSTPTDIMEAKPTLAQLMLLKLKSDSGEELDRVEIINTVAAEWKNICAAFEFDSTGSQLNNFAIQYAGQSPVEPCRAMFTHWLKGNGVEVTWKKLIEIISDTCKVKFAQKIKEILQKRKF